MRNIAPPDVVPRVKVVHSFSFIWNQMNLDSRKNEKNVMSPTEELFARCRHVIEKLPSSSQLRKIHYDLLGVLTCIERGPNMDRRPDAKVHIYDQYYEWYAWKKFTNIFTTRLQATHLSFKQLGMIEYIKIVLSYLEHLQLIKL